MVRRLFAVALALGTFAGAAPAVQAAEGYWSAQVSMPLGLSAGGGMKLGADDGSFRPAADAEVGLGGARIGVGLDRLGGGFGLGLRTSLLWTWLEPVEADADQTYLGVDLLAGLRSFVASVGGYRRIQGDGDDWLLSAGLGWRF